ncbi:MAG: FAD-binding oxidoreductase [Acidimicrobiia bacterium]|nr:FAD-binding oxidoreductase [Acidimicrobiia bacterium]
MSAQDAPPIGAPISDDALAELRDALDARRVTNEPHILDSYAAQPFHKAEPGVWIHRPIAVAMPETTREVQAIVAICNRHQVRFKALTTGWGAHAGPGFDNVLQVDMRRMNRILDIDVRNRTILVEPYVTCAQIQAELMPLGLNLHIHGAGSNCSPLASATSHMGMGFSSISMGYMPRNMLGVEWVLPTGELLGVGSCGSDAGWVSPDGPGPSLRGILRGWAGSDGGNGIFTKCALKLYPWSGPAEIDMRGTNPLELDLEIPPHNGIWLCVFPDAERYEDALYALGDAEIGYLQAKLAPGLAMAIGQPDLFKRVVNDERMRATVDSMRFEFLVVLQGHSRGRFEYEKKVLEQVVADNAGSMQDPSLFGSAGSLWWALVRNSIAPGMFRPTGNFYSTLGGDEAVASALRQDLAGMRLKEGFIADGACADDLTDNAHTLLYENGQFAHTEELVLFDHRDPEQAAKLKALSDTAMRAIVSERLGGGGFSFFAGAYAHDYLGPNIDNYHVWQRRVKTALDLQDLSDSKYYIDSEKNEGD